VTRGVTDGDAVDTPASGLTARKAAARKAAAGLRAMLHAAPEGPARAARAQDHLVRWLAGQGGVPLSGYLPIRSEIDPVPVMALHAGPVGVPVIDGPGLPLRFRVWTPGAALVRGPFGAMIPEAGDDMVPQVLIVPLMAWDRRGFRLGYGGGFYDRTLSALRAHGPVTAVGYAYAGQRACDLPVDPHDQRLDLIATETGVHRFDQLPRLDGG